MKTASFAAALLASAVAAQPHGHNRAHGHAKRAMVTTWEYVTETVSVVIDESTTETVYPPKPAATELPETTSIAPTPQTTFDSPTPTIEAVASTPTIEAVASTPTTPTTPTTFATSTSIPPAPTTEAAPTTTAASTTSQVLSVKSETSSAAGAVASLVGDIGANINIPFGIAKTGDLTYFDIGLGSCGYSDTGLGDSENIVAVSVEFWNSISTKTNAGLNQPLNPLCFQTITVVNEETGASAVAKIHDSCPECALDDIDGSPHLFIDLFGSTEAGRQKIKWSINQS
ncbi:hypothetical protein F4809DRAFT_586248 [Biscogniauxia mediterranea]|nr:hypothetical protein F4809DRAFT_586248 [Biscogniauxia mediterranea]